MTDSVDLQLTVFFRAFTFFQRRMCFGKAVCGFLPKRLLPKRLLPLDKRPKDFCPTDFCPKHKKVEIGRAAGTPITCVACCSLLFKILPLWEWKFWQIHKVPLYDSKFSPSFTCFPILKWHGMWFWPIYKGHLQGSPPLRFEIFTKLHLFSNFLVTWDVILANSQGPSFMIQNFLQASLVFHFFSDMAWDVILANLRGSPPFWFEIFTK